MESNKKQQTAKEPERNTEPAGENRVEREYLASADRILTAVKITETTEETVEQTKRLIFQIVDEGITAEREKFAEEVTQ